MKGSLLEKDRYAIKEDYHIRYARSTLVVVPHP
jgi:hypothetical protein